MMKAKILAASVAVLGASVIAPVGAADIYVNGTRTTTMSLDSLQVTGSNVVIRLLNSTGGDTGGGDTGGGDTGGGDTGGGDTGGGDTGGGDTGGGSTTCGATPSNVTVVNTGSLSTAFNQATYNPSNGNQIIAFRVTVPTSGAHQTDFRATKTTAASLAKLVSVSQCPGDYTNPVAGNLRGCTRFSTESSRIYLTSNQGASERSWCVLQPGQTYYVNAVAVERLDSTVSTCSNSTNCGFYAARMQQ